MYRKLRAALQSTAADALIIICTVFLAQVADAQGLYSYIDDSGVRVLTNIAPTHPVRDLKVSGAQQIQAPVTPTAQPEAVPQVPDTPKHSRFDPIIEKYASQYRLDPALIRSIIAKESGFNERAQSPKGATGLMQLMPSTASSLGVQNAFDPEQNIRGGVKHFRYLMDTFDNNLPLSLAAYNAGENRVGKLGRIPNIRETHDYVRTITRWYGSQKMVLQPPASAASRTFRFVDPKGVLHLTNIPPGSN